MEASKTSVVLNRHSYYTMKDLTLGSKVSFRSYFKSKTKRSMQIVLL